MRIFNWAAVFTVAGFMMMGLPGCQSGGGSGGSAGSGSGGDTGSAGAGSGGGAGSTAKGGGSGSGSGGSGGGAAAVTFMKDVLPIFSVKCAPCHARNGEASIFHTMAFEYKSATQNSFYCTGKKKGECTLVRIKDGTMPNLAGCKGDPVMDAANDKCLTQEQIDTVQAWIDGGLVEK